MREYTNQELMEGIKRGDSKIVEYLKKQHFGKIRKLLNDWRLGWFIEKEEVFSMAYVALVEKLQKENDATIIDNINKYFSGIINNKCLEVIKKMVKSRNLLDNYGSYENLYEEFFEDERLDLVMSIIKRMKEKCKEIINVTFGLSPEMKFTTTSERIHWAEVAAILKIEENAAKTRFMRCKNEILVEYMKRRNS